MQPSPHQDAVSSNSSNSSDSSNSGASPVADSPDALEVPNSATGAAPVAESSTGPVSGHKAAGERTGQWWRYGAVYQVYPRSFADSNGDGVGDIAGLLGKLDYLQWLGVQAVWLSPVYRSPQVDNGYDISDYQGIDPQFGTLEEIDELISQLHQRDMALVMDLVVNHSSDEHPWFLQSRADTDNSKRDWYYWRDPRPNPDAGHEHVDGFVEPAFVEPNNWSSVFLGPAWTLDKSTGQYYLHLFTSAQPDLNWENPDVRQAIYEMMRWWLDRGVDGFRMDVINLISKPEGLPNAPGGDGVRGGNQTQLLVGGPQLHPWLQEMHREVFARYPRTFLTVGEMPWSTIEEALAATDPARQELDMVFQFEHMDIDVGELGKFDPKPFRLTELKASLARWQAGLERGWNSLYFNNHDQPRVVSRWGDDGEFWRESATALAGMLHAHRGTPYVYQGEEIGMTNFPFTDIDSFADVEAHRAYELMTGLALSSEETLKILRARARDNARTPMQWDAGTQAGFTTGSPWLAVNPNHAWLNVSAQRDDPSSVLSFYRALIALRRTEPLLTDGDFTLLDPEHRQLWAVQRQGESGTLLALANFSADDLDFDLPIQWEGSEVILGNYSASGVPDALRPWEFRLVRLASRSEN